MSALFFSIVSISFMSFPCPLCLNCIPFLLLCIQFFPFPLHSFPAHFPCLVHDLSIFCSCLHSFSISPCFLGIPFPFRCPFHSHTNSVSSAPFPLPAMPSRDPAVPKFVATTTNPFGVPLPEAKKLLVLFPFPFHSRPVPCYFMPIPPVLS